MPPRFHVLKVERVQVAAGQQVHDGIVHARVVRGGPAPHGLELGAVAKKEVLQRDADVEAAPDDRDVLDQRALRDGEDVGDRVALGPGAGRHVGLEDAERVGRVVPVVPEARPVGERAVAVVVGALRPGLPREVDEVEPRRRRHDVDVGLEAERLGLVALRALGPQRVRAVAHPRGARLGPDRDDDVAVAHELRAAVGEPDVVGEERRHEAAGHRVEDESPREAP
mmetsp:Transcript_26274/g.88316  ORF Transcript_26274/g.88316 Transcript_26274/m.88316 type:complete len:225 (-) Transcript_26274:106-780(-)